MSKTRTKRGTSALVLHCFYERDGKSNTNYTPAIAKAVQRRQEYEEGKWQ
ncbi:MAG: hypothetical protein PUB08_00800 [Firmicutes bacterium]|nr:hypothetical protein [Bacillota bacterium]